MVTGVSHAFNLRKDADGRLGLGFAHGPPSRGVQGAVITDVMPKSAAFRAGLRNGDLLISVDGGLVTDQKTGLRLLTAAARALSGVIWRPRPDTDAAEGGGAVGGAAAAAMDDQPSHSSRSNAYYQHCVVPTSGGAGGFTSLPPQVPLYEDLTPGCVDAS